MPTSLPLSIWCSVSIFFMYCIPPSKLVLHTTQCLSVSLCVSLSCRCQGYVITRENSVFWQAVLDFVSGCGQRLAGMSSHVQARTCDSAVRMTLMKWNTNQGKAEVEYFHFGECPSNMWHDVVCKHFRFPYQLV